MSAEHSTAEEWREVPGRPDFWASNLGRVKKLVRDGGGRRYVKVLGSRLNKAGYPCVLERKYKVAIFVLLAFRGLRPEGAVARHLNDDKLDSRIENLVWGTQSENITDCYVNGHRKTRFTADDVREMRRLCAEGVSYREIAERFDSERTVVWGICKRRTWKHVA